MIIGINFAHIGISRQECVGRMGIMELWIKMEEVKKVHENEGIEKKKKEKEKNQQGKRRKYVGREIRKSMGIGSWIKNVCACMTCFWVDSWMVVTTESGYSLFWTRVFGRRRSEALWSRKRSGKRE